MSPPLSLRHCNDPRLSLSHADALLVLGLRGLLEFAVGGCDSQAPCLRTFAPKPSAGIRSERLLSGVHDAENRVILAGFARPLDNGAHLA